MDLGTIAKKCNEDQYFYVEEVLDDMQLVWDNRKLYNPPNSVLHVLLSGSIIWPKNWKDPSKKW